jgi:hypothetical protein
VTARSGDSQGTHRWSRYRRPGEPRSETDTAEDPKPAAVKTKPKPTSTKGSSSKPVDSQGSKKQDGKKSGSGKKTGGKAGWIVGGVLVAAVGIPVTIGVIAANTYGGSDSSDIGTETLEESFVSDALDGAAEIVGNQATRLSLDEYGLEVTAYDPTTDELKTYTVDTYTDGYTLRVEENAYDDYRPKPFYIDSVEPGVLISAAEDVLGRIDDPYTYDVSVEPDAETGAVSIVAYAWDGEDERVTVTSETDGSVVSVEDE